MLDGGHLVFYAFEALRGRPLSERVQEYAFRAGIAFVIVLTVFVTWNDITRIVTRSATG
jgi:regulator of sigma E protease